MERKQSRRTSFKSLPPAPRLRFWMYFSTQVDVLNSRTSFYPFATQLSRFPHPPRIPWIWNWLMTTKVVHRRTSSLVTLNEWVFVCSCLSQQEITYHRLKPLCLATFFCARAMHFFDWADICECHAKPGICTLVTLSNLSHFFQGAILYILEGTLFYPRRARHF